MPPELNAKKITSNATDLEFNSIEAEKHLFYGKEKRICFFAKTANTYLFPPNGLSYNPLDKVSVCKTLT